MSSVVHPDSGHHDRTPLKRGPLDLEGGAGGLIRCIRWGRYALFQAVLPAKKCPRRGAGRKGAFGVAARWRVGGTARPCPVPATTTSKAAKT